MNPPSSSQVGEWDERQLPLVWSSGKWLREVRHTWHMTGEINSREMKKLFRKQMYLNLFFNFFFFVNIFENDNVLLISVISVSKKYSNDNAFNV